MTTLLELNALVAGIIQDTSLEPSITEYLNRSVNEIAGGMLSTLGSFTTPPLPMLFSISTVDTVTTGASVPMPITFHRGLQFAADSSGREISTYESMIEFAEDYPLMDKVGRVDAAVELGGTLYYQRIPTVAETLTLHFYRLPVDMVADADVPDGIPSHLQVPLLVNHASWKLFDLIDDPVSGEGASTAHYKGLFAEALHTLELSIPVDARSFSTLSASLGV